MKSAAYVLTALVFILGCSSGTPADSVISGNDQVDGRADANGQVEVLFVTDTGAGDVAPDLEAAAVDAVNHDAPPLQCDPGEGCFMDGCTGNGDCQSSWCVEHMGEQVCTQPCQEECPPGWTCTQVAGTDPDLVFVCVSDHPNICRPCTEADDCAGLAGTEDACVAYGEQGSFCGGKCGDEGECPWGFSCQAATTVDGIELQQCVAVAGECPCTGTSVALGLFTSCQRTNEFGSCVGKRVCEESGLSECDAAVPGAEECNGADDDCDGDTDEETCDDGNQCTEDSCQAEDGCEHLPQESGECMDDNPCTKADHCEQGVCIGELVDCDDGNPCTDDYCTETGGCEHDNNYEACDDEDPCTLGDECKSGECVGIQFPCDCLVDEDCAELEDGDVCNGALYCDTAKLPYTCKVDPVTVVDCPAPEGSSAFCLKTLCASETGDCSFVPDHEGFPCEDGDLCTLGDKCSDGVCAAGMQVNCNDGNVCTDDSCKPDEGCIHEGNIVPCDDGDFCTVGDSCLDEVCATGAQKNCDDSNPCTDDTCEPGQGCAHSSNAADCDDENKCTLGDHCAGGFCAFNGLKNCDDGNPCTDDVCETGEGCVHSDNSEACDDGNSCTTGDHCEGGSCTAGEFQNCDDNNPCTQDLCIPDGQCDHVAVPGPCDDEDACTTGDHCSNGSCANLGAKDCDDGNLCTNDSCVPEIGCQYSLNAAACDDGNPCTTVDQCADGICVGGESDDCDDGNACTTDQCVPDAGCTHAPVPDGDPCGDDGGKCNNGQCACAADCEGKQCGPDGCGGDCGACDDDLWCTADSCDAGQCIHELELFACLIGQDCIPSGTENPLNPCEKCLPALAAGGWSYVGDGSKCGDGSACFQGNCCDPTDTCVGKECGNDGCGGVCGICPADNHSCDAGACVCQPECDGKACGDDGCGGSCGSCDDDEACVDGQCVCAPECAGKDCGDDGCGGSCGECGEGQACIAGNCPGDDMECDDGNDIPWDGCTLGKITEFRASTSIAGWQERPQVSVRPDGGFAIFWKSVNKLIAARVFGPDGQPEGYSEDVVLATSSYDERMLAVTNELLAVVRHKSKSNLWLRYYSMLGVPAGAEMAVLPNAADELSITSMASLGNGNMLLVWNRVGPYAFDSDVRAAILDNEGGLEKGPFKVNTSGLQTFGSGWSFSGACTWPDGSLAIVWGQLIHQPGNSYYRSYLQRFNADASKKGGEIVVKSNGGYRPRVACLDDGSHIVAYMAQTSDAIYNVVYSADGQKVGASLVVSTHTSNHTNAVDITRFGAQSAITVWDGPNLDGQDSLTDVYAQVVDSDGNKVGPEILVNAYTSFDQRFPQVDSLANGGAIVVWDSMFQDGDGAGVYAQRFDASGNKVYH